MASSGAARPILQRVLQTTTGGSLSSSSSQTPSLLLNHTQVRHATRATIAKAKAKAEALARRNDPEAPKPVKPKTVVRHHPNRDQNKQRGLSVMRQTGTRERLSVSGVPLPQPLSADEFPVVKTSPNHGLWDFFYSPDKPLNTPAEDTEHGRAWTVEELRRKGWDDLHSLWWVCIKERNRIATGNTERKKGSYGYGFTESRAREMEVRKTQNAIKHALTERFYAWEDAVKLAKDDPSISFTESGGVVYDGITERSLLSDDDDDIWEEEEEEEEEYEDENAKARSEEPQRQVGELELEDADPKAQVGEAKAENKTADPLVSGEIEKKQQDGPRA